MSEYYKYVSVDDWQTLPTNNVKKALESGKDPRFVRPTMKSLEAQKMRKALKFFTECRLQYLQKNEHLREFHEMNEFIDETPRYNCLFKIMLDFYNDQPTSRLDLEDALGKVGKKADRPLQMMVKKGSIVKEHSHTDKRITLFFPSVLTLLVFEFVIVPHYWAAWFNIRKENNIQHMYKDEYSLHALAQETIKWHAIHQKIYPKELQVALNPMVDKDLFPDFVDEKCNVISING